MQFYPMPDPPLYSEEGLIGDKSTHTLFSRPSQEQERGRAWDRPK